MIKIFLVMTLLIAPIQTFSFPQKPSEINLPHFCSKADSDFIELRYAEKIAVCKRNVSRSRRSAIYERYSIPLEDRKNYTIDHLVPLSLGGSNNDLNLWPQHNQINTAKYETELYRSVNSGSESIQGALNKILTLKYKK